MMRGMNLGLQPLGVAIFPVKHADDKCPAVDGTGATWQGIHEHDEWSGARHDQFSPMPLNVQP